MNDPLVIVTLIMGVIELLLTVALFYVGAKANRIDQLEETVTAKASEAMNNRFELLASEFTGMVTPVRTLLESVDHRLDRGDKAFDRQDEMQRKLEVDAQRRLAGCVQKFATREDLAELAAEMRKLEVKLAKFEERLHVATREER